MVSLRAAAPLATILRFSWPLLLRQPPRMHAIGTTTPLASGRGYEVVARIAPCSPTTQLADFSSLQFNSRALQAGQIATYAQQWLHS